jgi:hypothetical protein
MSKAQQSREALAVANTVRIERAVLRAKVVNDACSLRELFADPPDALSRAPIWQVLCWRLSSWQVARLNRKAIDARVNLALPIASLNTHTREWLCEHV